MIDAVATEKPVGSVESTPLPPSEINSHTRRLISNVVSALQSSLLPKVREAVTEEYYGEQPDVEFKIGQDQYIINRGHGTYYLSILRKNSQNPTDWVDISLQYPSEDKNDPVKEAQMTFQSPTVFTTEDQPGQRKPIINTQKALQNSEVEIRKLIEELKENAPTPPL